MTRKDAQRISGHPASGPGQPSAAFGSPLGVPLQSAFPRAAAAGVLGYLRLSAFFFLLSAFSSLAQESVRMSLASAEAAEARRKAATTVGYYNLRLGQSAWNFNADLGLEANDNIRLESQNPKEDLILRPQIGARMFYPVSDQNSLNLTVGGGYSAYVRHSEFDRWYLTPGSELSFDLYVGDFWINLHDRFSITEDTYQDPTVVGSGNYSRLQNAIGATAAWDLNKVVLRAGYDHVNYVGLQGNTQAFGPQPDGDAEVFSSSAGYTLRPGLLVGTEAGWELIQYSRTSSSLFFTDATEWSLGGFCEAQLSEYIKGRGSVGYTLFSPTASGSGQFTGNFSGVYAQLDLTHRVNQFVSYTLSGGRTINYTLYGGTLDLSDARLALNWNLVRKFGISTSFEYEHGSQIVSGAETFDRYGPGVSLSRGITAKLSASLSYQFYWRGSDLPNRDYSVNVVLLDLRYQF